MITLIKTLLQHWFTARDNTSYSFTKLLGSVGGGSMIYKFITNASPTPDYVGFGAGVAAIMAALAAKYLVETPETKQ